MRPLTRAQIIAKATTNLPTPAAIVEYLTETKPVQYRQRARVILLNDARMVLGDHAFSGCGHGTGLLPSKYASSAANIGGSQIIVAHTLGEEAGSAIAKTIATELKKAGKRFGITTQHIVVAGNESQPRGT